MAALIPEVDWNKVISESDFFFNKEYLSLIETCENTQLECRYVVFYKNHKACGIAYFQLIDFKAGVFGELLQQELLQVQSKRMKLFEKYIQSKDKTEVLMRLLTCGNNLISGDYGFKRNTLVNEKMFFQLLCTAIKTISSEDHLRSRLSAVLLKDFEKPLHFFEDPGNFKGKSFTVEPNMIIELTKGLKSLEDYITLFSKKYRNRAKGILKKRENLVFRELNEKEIEDLLSTLNHLYNNLYSKAKFKLLMLPEMYFLQTKKIFGKHFKVKVIFNDNKPVAYMSAFVMNDGTLEAHYIGMDYGANETFELYQNMLYEFIQMGIDNACDKINLGRTAAEIKSTVGAKAQDLICYVQAQNPVSKLIVGPFIDFLKPKHWIPRNPFKEEDV